MKSEILIGNGKRPVVATHIDGSIHIVYINNGIRYRRYHPTTGFGNEELITFNTAWWAHIAVSVNGDVHVVWEESTDGTGYIGYARKVSGNWKLTNNLHTTTYRAMMPRIATDANNRAHIVFWKNVASGITTLARGQYTRIGLANNIPSIELNVDIFGWDGNRLGDVIVDSNNVVHIFSGHVNEVTHWTISELGILTLKEPFIKPLLPNIEKFAETCSVSLGLDGIFYGASKDAGDPLTNPVKEVIHMRTGRISLVTNVVEPLGGFVKSVGDKLKSGLAYIVYADAYGKGQFITIDSNNIQTNPIQFATTGIQHDGEPRHCPTGVGAIDGGLWIAYQDNRSGVWQTYIRQVNEIGTPPINSIAPKQSEWIEKGRVLSSGNSGQWDAYFGGAISPCSIIKKNGLYFMYYIAGTEARSPTDGEAKYRSVGVATSMDGIRFTKYAKNPILIHKSANAALNPDEEGIFSVAAMLDDNGDVLIYYAALNAISSTGVDSSINMAVSSNGYDFVGIKVVSDARTSGIWGYGDELFPIGALKTNGKYYVYYIAKGFNGIMWDLGIGSGILKDHFDTSQGLLQLPTITGSSNNDYVGGSAAVIKGSNILSFLELGRTGKIEIRSSLVSNPLIIGGVSDNYNFTYIVGSVHHATFYDADKNMWLMYYWDGNHWGGINVRTVNYSSVPCSPAQCNFTITQQ